MKKIKLRKQKPRKIDVYPVEVVFCEWLKENIDRFNFKPILQYVKDGTGVYSFEGIVDNISLVVAFYSPESMVFFDNLSVFCEDPDDTYFDHHVVDYIGEEQYHPTKGYYDAENGVYDYFPTQKELYINNIFEPIIEYCNIIFVPENSLELLKMGCGSTAGCIRATEKIESEALDFIDKFQDVTGVTVWKYKDGYTKYKYDLFCT